MINKEKWNNLMNRFSRKQKTSQQSLDAVHTHTHKCI